MSAKENIAENVQEMSELLKGQMTVGDQGVIEYAEGTLEKTLEGTDLTVDDFKKTHEHRDTLIAANSLAVGELGMAEMAKNKELNQVSSELKIHKDVIGTAFHRSRNLPDGDGGMRAKPGVLANQYKANGQVGSKGQLKKVKAALSEEALSVLSD